MRRIFTLLCGLLLSAVASAVTIDGTLVPTTTYDTVPRTSLPASGAGALTSHRVEYGTCIGAAFGTSLGSVVVPMPAVKFRFLNAPSQVLCIRAFPSNAYGEGKPYPVMVIGPAPSDGGAIVTVTVGP